MRKFTAVLLVILFSLILGACSVSPSATYTASVTGISVENASHVIVYIQVNDTSKVAGTPTCTDSVNDAAGDFSVNGPVNPIPAGKYFSYQDDVTIADGNAAALTQSMFSVTCN